jgi:hypothetical protein
VILVVHLNFEEPVIGLWRKLTLFASIGSQISPAKLGLGIEEEEDGGQDSGSDVDYDMEEDY